MNKHHAADHLLDGIQRAVITRVIEEDLVGLLRDTVEVDEVEEEDEEDEEGGEEEVEVAVEVEVEAEAEAEEEEVLEDLCMVHD